jgi:hypothetical protein
MKLEPRLFVLFLVICVLSAPRLRAQDNPQHDSDLKKMMKEAGDMQEEADEAQSSAGVFSREPTPLLKKPANPRMKPRKLTIVLFAAAQMFAANFVSAQTASATPVAPMTPPGPPPFGKPNLTDMLTRLLLLTDAQKAQLQPYVDAVQLQARRHSSAGAPGWGRVAKTAVCINPAIAHPGTTNQARCL